VQMIENKAKMHNGKLARAMLLSQEVVGSKRRRVLSPQRHVSSHVSCHMLPRGTAWLPRNSGGHHLTQPLTGGQPLLIGGPAMVDRWSGGGPTVVDGGPPPLTVVGHR
ncbi:hypothetical protein Tco_0147266, partial [Tanacetum coccineum]